jgi:membrane fusion protein, multidrug efflux system
MLVVASIVAYWEYTIWYPSTDDAYVQAHVISIAPQVAGKVTQVLAKDNQVVAAGDPLFIIDRRDYQNKVTIAREALILAKQHVAALTAQVALAKANVAKSKAALVVSQKNAKRILKLVQDGNAAPTVGDKVTAELNQAKAAFKAAISQLQVAQDSLGKPGDNNAAIIQAQANLKMANLDLSRVIVTAPASGQITNLNLRVGDTVGRGEKVFSLIESGDWWVRANFKETQMARIQPNQRATIHSDMYPKEDIQGVVDSISAGSQASFSLLPAENASGNWVKVSQRFPIKIRIVHYDKSKPLRLGSTATVTINTR